MIKDKNNIEIKAGDIIFLEKKLSIGRVVGYKGSLFYHLTWGVCFYGFDSADTEPFIKIGTGENKDEIIKHINKLSKQNTNCSSSAEEMEEIGKIYVERKAKEQAEKINEKQALLDRINALETKIKALEEKISSLAELHYLNETVNDLRRELVSLSARLDTLAIRTNLNPNPLSPYAMRSY